MNLVRLTSFCFLLLVAYSHAYSQVTHRQVSTLTERYVSGNWQDYSVATYTHDFIGDKFSHWLLEHIDANGTHKNFQQASFSYHEITRLLELKETQYWSDATNSWINSQRFEFSYTNEMLDVLNHYGWLPDQGIWQHFSIDSFFYDGYGDCIKFLNYSLRQGSFVLSNQADYSYGSAGKLDSTKHFTLINASMVHLNKLTYYRDAAGRDTAIYRDQYHAMNGSYLPNEMTRYIRNAAGDCIRAEFLTFNLNTQEWDITGFYDFKVNGLVNKEQVLFDIESFPYIYFENTLTQWTLSKSLNGIFNKETRTTYFFDKALPNGVNKMEIPRALVFPNPCTGMLQVDLSKLTEASSIVLFDAQGRKIHTQTIQQYVQLNVANFAAGLYVLHILDSKGNRLASSKFVKE